MKRFGAFRASRIAVGTVALVLTGTAFSTAAAAAPAPTAAGHHAKQQRGKHGQSRNQGPLKVCTTGDYAPLTVLDSTTGTYSGIDIDMARNFAAYLHRKVQFVPTTWATLSQDIATPGKCDIAVGGISVTAARQQVADFTNTVLTTGKTPITTTANEQRFQTIDEINQPDVHLIVDSGGQNETYAEQTFPKADLTVVQDNESIFGELLNGDADVFVTDAIEGVYQAQQNPGLVAVHPDQPFTTDNKAYMLPKGSPLLKPANKWLKKVLNDGTFQRYYDSWIKS